MGGLQSRLNSAKANFDTVYVAKTPVPYMTCMSSVGYEIPQNARPVFESLIHVMERERGRQINVLDLGASYGVNAALLRYNIDLPFLYAHYAAHAHLTGEELLEVDRRYFRRLPGRLDPYLIGLDASSNAISYALKAGLLDFGLALDLEDEGSTPYGGRLDVDLVISTGTIGYVGPRTLSRVLDLCRNPDEVWIASFALCLVDFEPYQSALRDRGLRTETVKDLFVQRRFLDQDERSRTALYAKERGLSALEHEIRGKLASRLFLSRAWRPNMVRLPELLNGAIEAEALAG